MGMLAELNAELSAAFSDPEGLADAVRPFTGSRVTGTGQYNPDTGTTDSGTLTYTGRGIFASYAAKEIDGTVILSTDERLTALQAEVTEAPQVGDTINGKRVQHVGKDAVGATWVLQLRAG